MVATPQYAQPEIISNSQQKLGPLSRLNDFDGTSDNGEEDGASVISSSSRTGARKSSISVPKNSSVKKSNGKSDELSVIGTQISSQNKTSSPPKSPTKSNGNSDADKSSYDFAGYPPQGKLPVDFEDQNENEDEDTESETRSRSLGKSEFRTAQRFTVRESRRANRAWAGAIVAPSNYDETSARADLPSQTLELEHIYVYSAGAVGVVHDIKSNKQKFFRGRHREDVVSVAVHPSGKLIATGDIVCHDDGCYVYMWDPFAPEDEKRQIQIRIGEKKLGKGVADVEFSPDGKWLIAVGMDADHT
ncbi:hypothetical protein HK096_005083, partial [Nowakowskiella sp. JEL0078]